MFDVPCTALVSMKAWLKDQAFLMVFFAIIHSAQYPIRETLNRSLMINRYHAVVPFFSFKIHESSGEKKGRLPSIHAKARDWLYASLL
jgi:hypothetical protein